MEDTENRRANSHHTPTPSPCHHSGHASFPLFSPSHSPISVTRCRYSLCARHRTSQYTRCLPCNAFIQTDLHLYSSLLMATLIRLSAIPSRPRPPARHSVSNPVIPLAPPTASMTVGTIPIIQVTLVDSPCMWKGCTVLTLAGEVDVEVPRCRPVPRQGFTAIHCAECGQDLSFIPKDLRICTPKGTESEGVSSP